MSHLQYCISSRTINGFLILMANSAFENAASSQIDQIFYLYLWVLCFAAMFPLQQFNITILMILIFSIIMSWYLSSVGVRFLLILMSIYFKENLSITATKYKTEDTENYINKVKLQNIRLLITPVWDVVLWYIVFQNGNYDSKR